MAIRTDKDKFGVGGKGKDVPDRKSCGSGHGACLN